MRRNELNKIRKEASEVLKAKRSYRHNYWHISHDVADIMENLNKEHGFYGVETIYHSDGYMPKAYFLNTGDSYALTLFWIVSTEKFRVSSWATIAR